MMLKQKPLVGVLITKRTIRKLRAQTRESLPGINGLRNANRKAQTNLFFFSLDDFNLEKQHITGTYYNETMQKWESNRYPMPDVLYNRRSEGGTPKARRFRKLVAGLKIKTINPVNDFYKWDLYRRLWDLPQMRPHMPQTVIYRESDDLQVMLDRYKTVYLKPVKGRYSNQVVRIRQLESDAYEYSYVDDQLRIKVADSWNQLINFIPPFYKGKQFVVQEAIQIYKLNGRIVDMRAELQRNRQGELVIVAISARLGAPHSPVSSTRADTTIFRFADFFKENLTCSKEELNNLFNQVDEFLKKVFLSVEKIYGVFGDMGIDFALDRDLNLWLIECNSKSAKVALFLSFDQPVIDSVFLNPLEYAKFLTELSNK